MRRQGLRNRMPELSFYASDECTRIQITSEHQVECIAPEAGFMTDGKATDEVRYFCTIRHVKSAFVDA